MNAEQEAVRQLPSADRVWAPDGHLMGTPKLSRHGNLNRLCPSDLEKA